MNKRVALVTGANRGIGYEIARRLAAESIKVIVASRDLDKGNAAVQRLQADGADVEFAKLDVTSDQDVAALHSYVKDKYGALDILVNNAGILIDSGNGLKV